MKSTKFLSVSLLPLAIAATPMAFGQADTNTEAETKTLDTVTVTATRTEKDLQEVPVSVAVITGDTLDTAGAITFADIGFSAGNFVANESANNPNIGGVSIRGIQGRAGVYVDDVLISDSAAVNSTLVDVERVEILRGPQGATFGANTIAGAVNTITRKPSFEWEGTADATLGSFGFEQYRAGISGPIMEDQAAFKLTGFMRESDGPDTTIETNKDVNGEDEWGLRGAVLLTPSEDLEILLNADYSEVDIKDGFIFDFLSETPGSLVQPLAAGLFGTQPFELNTDPNDRRVWDTTVPNQLGREIFGYSANVTWDVGDMTLTSITAYRGVDTLSIVDEDRLPIYLAGNEVLTEQTQFTQEFRLNGSFNNIDWLVGAFYLDDERESQGTLEFSTLALIASNVPAQFAGIGGVEATTDISDFQDLAAFGSVGFNFMDDRLNVTVGGRVTQSTLNQTQGESIGTFGGRTVLNTQGRPDESTLDFFEYPEIEETRFDPSASVTYALTDDINIFAAYGTGFRRPAYNSRDVCQGADATVDCFIEEEEATNFEVGIKSEWFDNTLRLNVVAYALAYDNLQRSQGVLNEDDLFTGATVTTNVDTTSEGLEIEALWQATDEFTWELNAGYQNATYDNSEDNNNVPVGNADGSGTILIDARGETLPGAPEYTLSTAGTYDRPIRDNLNLLARIEYQYRDDFVTNLGPNPALQVDSQENLNATLGIYQNSEKGFSLMLRGRNILDNQYFSNASSVAGIGQFIALSDPATYTAELRVKF
ncbi:MAG: TonB-dependent receptor [Henriciella sp.]|nr:TonB-dependent receptor [Henriciella sp.]